MVVIEMDVEYNNVNIFKSIIAKLQIHDFTVNLCYRWSLFYIKFVISIIWNNIQ